MTDNRRRYRVRHERLTDWWAVYDHGEPPGSARAVSVMSVKGGVGGISERLIHRFADELEAERRGDETAERNPGPN